VTSWIQKHKADIVFVVTMLVGSSLVLIGALMNEISILLMGGGALGLPGFADLAGDYRDNQE